MKRNAVWLFFNFIRTVDVTELSLHFPCCWLLLLLFANLFFFFFSVAIVALVNYSTVLCLVRLMPIQIHCRRLFICWIVLICIRGICGANNNFHMVILVCDQSKNQVDRLNSAHIHAVKNVLCNSRLSWVTK